MAATSSSEQLRHERRWFLAVALVLVAEAAGAISMVAASQRFDLVFLAAERRLHLAKLLAAPINPGETVMVIGANGLSKRVILEGDWSAPEESGVWTDGKTAAVTVATSALPGSAILELTGDVEPDRSGRQGIVVSVDGVVVQRLAFRGGPAAIPVPLPSTRSGGSGTVTVRLGILHPSRPPGADPRHLGFFLGRISLLTARAPPLR